MKKLLIIFLVLVFFKPAMSQISHENFSFDLKFGFIKGGEATFVARDTIIDGHSKLHVTLHAFTTGFAKLLYGVDDRFESVLTSNKLLPLFSTKYLQEQNYRFYNMVQYYHDEDKVYSERSGWYFVDDGICDVSSMVYNLRHSGKIDNLKLKQIIEMPFWDTDEWYLLKMQFTGIEKVKTRLGTFECIRLEPLEVSGRFFNKKNPMNIWITNDVRKLPVLMELNFTIGSVKCELKSI